MAEETITIYKVNTTEAVKSIGDLKENIKQLKKEIEGYDEVVDGEKKHINGLTIGTEEYAEALNELKVNQNALKDAMYATSSTIEQVTEAATGAGTSYNALVHRMAALKEEFRATGDAARREDLGAQIKEVNDQLKEMDALQGNFQRNVGNYEGALVPVVDRLDKMGGILKNFPPTLGAAKEQIGKVGESMQLVGKQPILGIIGLLAPIIMKIAGALKENKTALDSIDKVMKALQPVFDFAANILEKIAGWIAKAVDYFVSLSGESGETFKKIIAGAVGVGNTIVQFLLTPIRNVIAAVKGLGTSIKSIFKGDFKQAAQDAKTALSEIGDSFKKGFSFKENFETGKKVGEEFAQGLKSKESKEAVKAAAKELKEEVKDVFAESDADIAEAEKVAQEEIDREKKKNEEILAENREFFDEQIAALQEQDRREAEERQRAIDAELQAEADALERKKELAQKRAQIFQESAASVASVASTLADIYEANADADEQATQKAKEFRVAAAIISAISGAVSAYRSTMESVPAPANMVLAPVNAATALAAGYAQVKQIQAVKVGDSTGGASVSAPKFSPAIQQFRGITGASEEERLNKMADKQRVYLVYSDIQVANTNQRVKVQETEF